MILGQDLLIELGLNLKFYEHVIEADYVARSAFLRVFPQGLLYIRMPCGLRSWGRNLLGEILPYPH